MAAYAALASLMSNIDQIMIHPLLSTSLHNKQIQPLLQTATSLLDFIEAYNYGGVISKEVQDLERRIASAAHAAEDVIESHIVHQIHAGSSQPSLSCSLDLQQIIEDMDTILKKANELKEKNASKEEQLQVQVQPTHSSTPLMVMDQTGETAMVGFDDELIQLMDELTSQRSSRHVISIVGMGGMGKTTLALNLYHNSLMKHHFDIRVWATVSQQYNAKQILSQLLSGQENSCDTTLDGLGEQLHKTLSGRRYLIVLDDVWSVKAWDEVRHFFPDNGNRSRVVLTTRMSIVARDCGSNSCSTMKPLDEHKSWELFCKKAFEQEICPYPELEEVGKKIARSCRGLPLSTVVIGGFLLKSPRSLQFWEKVVRNTKLVPDSKEREESLDILSLSYNHLPPHLKPCFLYMGVFKEDSEIRVSKIVNLWVAEGFIRPNNTQVLEEVAEGYLKELIDRNLITVNKHRNNGKIGSCGIHDLLRDLCSKVAEQQELFHVSKGEIGGTERRLICSDGSGLQDIEPSLVRSILARSKLRHPGNHKLLRVWDEGLLRSRAEIYGNVNLRYFAYTLMHDQMSERKLLSSVSLIWNLQTLIIKQSTSCAVVVAPIEIWRMRQLRHVKVKGSMIYVPDPPPCPSDGLFLMDNLRTLTTALNVRLSEEVCKLIPNIKKLHVTYGRNWHGYDDSLIEYARNLDCLHKLESLKLSIRESIWQTQGLDLNKTVRFPISLNKLSLYGCQLRSEYLRMIGSLPQLEVLQLRHSCFMEGNEWSPVDEQFLRLKFLKIDYCGLTRLDADDSHFPVLEKLFLGHLWNLEEIPLGIGEIPTLQLIRVDCCSESTAISAMRIKDQVENQGTDDLQIQIRMSDSEIESFKERVKTEELRLDHIQLEIETENLR